MLLVVPSLVPHFSGRDQLLLSRPLLVLECTKAYCLVEILRELVVQILVLVRLAAIMATALVNGTNAEKLDHIDA